MSSIKGIDVSHYQGIINWEEVKANGINFAFIKATQGNAGVDKKIAANINGCETAKMPYGCYHFLTSAPVDKQVQRFLTITPVVTPLPAVLDYEDLSVPSEVALQWLQAVEIARQYTPILYIDPDMIQHIGTAITEFLKYPLWIAEYGVLAPKFQPWEKWTFWQYGSGDVVPGITQPVDSDWFNGTLEELNTV